MAQYTKDNGSMIRFTAKESVFIMMEPHTQDNGLKIDNKVMERKSGQMELVIKEIIRADLNKDMVPLYGLMVVAMMVSSNKITLMVLVIINGQMVASTKANGKIAK